MDRVTKSQRSYIMSRVRGRDTRLEVAVRKALWAQGYRYRIHYGYGKADIAFPRRKVAIFIDSCFWHKCPIHGQYPKSNVTFWRKKLRRTLQRDRKVIRTLKARGWRVLRVWEHALQGDLDGTLKAISKAIERRSVHRAAS